MRVKSISRPLRLCPLLLVLLLASGCQDYEIQVVLEPDGGGRRSVSLELDTRPGDEGTPDLDEFRAYFGLDAALGWRQERDSGEVDEGSARRPRTHFTREAHAVDAASWSESDGDLRVRATLGGGPYEGVEFSNSIAVVSGRENGAPWLRYEETFRWRDLLRSVLSLQGARFDSLVTRAFPEMDPMTRGELHGLLTGAFLADLRLQLDDAEDDEREAARSLYGQLLLDTLSRHGHRGTIESVEALLSRAITDPDGEGEAQLTKAMPGLDQAFLTSIELKVSFPGVIVESNADEVVGNTARWRFDITDSVFEPVVLSARAMIQD